MKQYLDLMNKILVEGEQKEDRTGTGTLSLFGEQLKFDLREGFPLVTTKKMFFKGIVHELLWFLKGDTNLKYLQDNNVKIWEEWKDTNNEIPFSYPHQWRNWNNQGIDQIKNVVENLKHDPFSRRHIVTAWNPSDVPNMTITSCHTLFQFNCAKIPFRERFNLLGEKTSSLFSQEDFADGNIPEDKVKQYFEIADELPSCYLDCRLDQRSADLFLGSPFNIASYSLLTHMVAQVTNMIPRFFVYQLGDVHLYLNHLEQAREQLSREPLPLPSIALNPNVKDIDDFMFEDIKLKNYQHHKQIKAQISV